MADEKKLVQSGNFEKNQRYEAFILDVQVFQSPLKKVSSFMDGPLHIDEAFHHLHHLIKFNIWFRQAIWQFERSSNTRMIEIQFWEGQ